MRVIAGEWCVHPQYRRGMEKPSWHRQVVGWPDHHEPSPRFFYRLHLTDGARLFLRQQVNIEGDRAIRIYTEPWGWRGPEEPAYNLLLHRGERGRWSLFESLPRWWTPLWFQHAERKGRGGLEPTGK
jgi:hypothetical protein